jgi:hypothetical protein
MVKMIGMINEKSGSESSKCPPSRSQVSTNHRPPAKPQRLSQGYTETNADNQGTRRSNPRYEHVSTPGPFETSIDRIFIDLDQNRERAPWRRRYSLDILTWAREIATASPAAYRTIRRSLPLPLERLLQEWFMNFQLHFRHALTGIEDMDF